MSFHRAMLVALATLFTTLGMTSLASAGCCNNWGYSAPVNYGCGGCGTPTYAAVYAVPVGAAVQAGAAAVAAALVLPWLHRFTWPIRGRNFPVRA